MCRVPRAARMARLSALDRWSLKVRDMSCSHDEAHDCTISEYAIQSLAILRLHDYSKATNQ